MVLLPFFLLAGVLSFPFAMLAGRIQRHKRQRNKQNLEVQMSAQGRVMGWPDFLKALNETRGTAIVERYSLKGPVHLWWTSDNVYEVCPHPTVDWMALHDESYGPFAAWCRERYTGPDAGTALLVSAAPPTEGRSLYSRFESCTGPERWIEIVPPELVRKAASWR